ncbi:hypothetical protein D3C81_1844240 [compost metagenome]
MPARLDVHHRLDAVGAAVRRIVLRPVGRQHVVGEAHGIQRGARLGGADHALQQARMPAEQPDREAGSVRRGVRVPLVDVGIDDGEGERVQGDSPFARCFRPGLFRIDGNRPDACGWGRLLAVRVSSGGGVAG